MFYLNSALNSQGGNMGSIIIKRLQSGGLITNYHCTSKCRHCLYRCSPGRRKDYVEKDDARKIMHKIISLGCSSIHIGGGEPFLDIEKLIDVADAAKQTGMHIEYIETNSSWFTDEDKAVGILNRLLYHGIDQLLISISPFHNEHIPFFKTKGVIKACRKTGMGIFPWIAEFYPEADSLDDRKVHRIEEYQEKFGTDYMENIPRRYWTHLGGRAVETFRDILPLSPIEHITGAQACHEPEDTSHFHIDLYGQYIPGLCAGFVIDMEDLGQELDTGRYPLLNLLSEKGIGAMLSLAEKEYGFKSGPGYLNKCHLCNDIRSHLVKRTGYKFPELGPEGYYSQ